MSKIVGPQSQTIINNAIRGFLEVITFRASEAVLKSYQNKKLILIRIGSNSQVMNMAPAKLYEVLAIKCSVRLNYHQPVAGELE